MNVRDIKFRVWDKYDKSHLEKRPRMLQVTGIMTYSNTDKLDIGFLYGRGMFAPDEVEIMQFTGLNDKNGKEIYEGDIVKLEDYHGERIVEIMFHNGVYYYGGDGFSDEYIFNSHEREIIGNIYENAELLGGDSNA